MKKIFITSSLVLSISMFSQTVSDLKFDSGVIDSENSYVVLPKKETDQRYGYGFIYFDEMAGYSFRSLGDLVVENGKLKVVTDQFHQSSMMISRIGNFNLKTAKLNDDVVKKLKLESPPKWLEIYKSSKPENEKILNRASKLNGANNAQLALPKLLELYKNNFKTESLYFELAFSYNALGKFAEGEKISLEALNNKKADDLVKKEYIYSLVHQDKVKEADDFLSKNISSFKTQNNKIEAIINTIAVSAHNGNLTVAEKWMKELKSEPNIDRYQKNIQQLESIIKEKQSKIL
jgi:tetratricopeptide (TPR) repeat protein